MDAWSLGFAIRRDWPDGSHELVGFTESETRAERFVRRDREYWRRGPVRPRSWQIVAVSRRDFDLHERRFGCQAPDCPTADDRDPLLDAMPWAWSQKQAWPVRQRDA
jgi:hypothetical protein